MSAAVPSDGSNQKLFDEFLNGFYGASKQDADKAMDWFAQSKANGRERMDDIKLPSLCRAVWLYYDKHGHAPAILKKYLEIKLRQGKTSWSQELDNHSDAPKFPWE